MTTSTAATEGDALNRFTKETVEHTMTVLHDEGLYKHLLFAKPGSSFYHYALITWPDYLTITGDSGTWTFRCNQDMLAFFRADRPDRINASFWAEKLQTGDSTGAGKAYDETLYRRAVMEHLSEWLSRQANRDLTAAQAQDLYGSVWTNLLDSTEWDYPGAFHETARDRTADYRHQVIDGGPEFGFTDSSEWDLLGYSMFFLWCCYAIQAGIHQYDTNVVSEGALA
jgi:hypothetical protein